MVKEVKESLYPSPVDMSVPKPLTIAVNDALMPDSANSGLPVTSAVHEIPERFSNLS
jgi:hypothetical protein